MCFSATASFTSSAILFGLGLSSLAQASRTKLLPLAAIPFIFSIQQFLEGLVWISPQESWLFKIGAYGFFFFATIFWAVWIPYSTFFAEKNRKRKKWLYRGLVSSSFFPVTVLPIMVYSGVEVNRLSEHITYEYISNYFSAITPILIVKWAFLICYSFYVTVPCFISTIRNLWIFGAVIVISWILAQLLYAHSFGSVWCFFGAIGSVVIYFVIRQNRRNFLVH